MSYIVYKMVHIPTGNIVYVGSTSRKLSERMREHRCKSNRSPACDWIKEVGKENVRLEEICKCETKEESLEKEIYWTNELRKSYKLFNKYTGNKHSEEQKAYMSKLHSGVNHPCYGSTFNNVKVRCTTTGKEFDSMKEAAKYYDIKCIHIGEVCVGKREHCGKLKDGTKLSWEYIKE